MLKLDLKIISDIVSPNSKVLEIGCGNGDLLKHLDDNKNTDSRGIELVQHHVSEAVKKGLSVIQGDVDIDLQIYPDKCFDYVISNQVLQATKAPKEVLKELLRISQKVIISMPNFGYWKNRYYLTVKGKMPLTKTLSYQWYETPNIHFCTIDDFKELCYEVDAKIGKIVFFGKNKKLLNFTAKAISKNLFSEKAIFIVSK